MLIGYDFIVIFFQYDIIIRGLCRDKERLGGFSELLNFYASFTTLTKVGSLIFLINRHLDIPLHPRYTSQSPFILILKHIFLCIALRSLWMIYGTWGFLIFLSYRGIFLQCVSENICKTPCLIIGIIANIAYRKGCRMQISYIRFLIKMFIASMINTSRDYRRTKQFSDSKYNTMKKKIDFAALLHVGSHTRSFRSYIMHKLEKKYFLCSCQLISSLIKICGDLICKEFDSSLKFLSSTLSLILNGLKHEHINHFSFLYNYTSRIINSTAPVFNSISYLSLWGESDLI